MTKREGLVPLAEDVRVPDHGAATRTAILMSDMISRLSAAQAAVIRLVKLHGASIQEASETTGQSASLVKVNMHRGLKRIAVLLDAERLAT